MTSNDGVNPPNQLQRNASNNFVNRIVSAQAPRAIPLSSHYLQQPMATPTSFGGVPPVPVRRAPVASYGRMAGMGMGGYYSPYSRYPTNMYTPGYGGGFGRMSPYGPYGAGENPPFNSFIQMAEESTRPAFESIESVVEVVGSISMMLESTYHAVHSSYSAILGVVDQFSRLRDHLTQMLSILALLRGLRWLCLKVLYILMVGYISMMLESTYHAVHSSYSAILGVVDQFSRLRDHLTQMLSILALLRGLRWLCLKVLYILRLRKDNPSDETAWNTAGILSGHLPPLPDKGAQGSAWPFLMFIGLVIGAPWLMFKLLSKSVSKKPLDLKMFRDENGRRHTSTAAYDFKATQRDELSFSAGERLFLAPSSYKTGPKGWVYACNSKQETGLVPQNYLATVMAKKTKPATGGPLVSAPKTTGQPALAGGPTTTPLEQPTMPVRIVLSNNPAENVLPNFPDEVVQSNNPAVTVPAQPKEKEAPESGVEC